MTTADITISMAGKGGERKGPCYLTVIINISQGASSSLCRSTFTLNTNGLQVGWVRSKPHNPITCVRKISWGSWGLCRYRVASGHPAQCWRERSVALMCCFIQATQKTPGKISCRWKGDSFSSSQATNIKENTIMRCLTGETRQNFSFIQCLCFNVKPQVIS